MESNEKENKTEISLSHRELGLIIGGLYMLRSASRVLENGENSRENFKDARGDLNELISKLIDIEVSHIVLTCTK